MLLAGLLSLLFVCDPVTQRSKPQNRIAAPAFVKPNVAGVFLIILENGDVDEARKMSFLRDKRVKHRVLLTNYAALAHPSRPNYIGLVSGSIAGTNGDCEPRPALKNRHLADLLNDAKKDWRVYAEDYRGNCDLTDDIREVYVRRHLGFLDFADVQQQPSLCKHIVRETEELTTLQRDIENKRVPPFAMLIPNNNHNGHNAGLLNPALGIKSANHWLRENFAGLLKTQFTKGRVFVITFDENEKHGPNDDNKVFIVLWGDPIQPPVNDGTLNIPYNHYDLLRTIEELLGLGSLHAGDAKGQPIGGIWKAPTPSTLSPR